jgi:heterodisulfide reductase subunit A
VGMMPSAIPELIDRMKLPLGTDRFLQEVHPKLRPVEVAVDGILLAGTAQGPMTVDESLLAASASAVKVSAMLARDVVELDPYVAEVDETLCCGTGLCIGECEYTGAIRLVEKEVDGAIVKRAIINPGLCKGCGACVAVCPNRAIDVKGFTLAQFEAMVNGIAADLPSSLAEAGGKGDAVPLRSE